MTLTVGVIGIDHRHIFGQLENMQSHGCVCTGWYTDGEPQPLEGFIKRFPDIPRVPDQQTLLQDPEIDMILIADIPSQRAESVQHASQKVCGENSMEAQFTNRVRRSTIWVFFLLGFWFRSCSVERQSTLIPTLLVSRGWHTLIIAGCPCKACSMNWSFRLFGM